MQLSKLIARIASVVYLSASLGAFFSTDYYRKIAEDLFSNSALTYVTGFIIVIIGFLIVTYHNTWTKSWIVLITILGWLAMVKRHLPHRVSAICSHVIRANAYRFECKNLPIRRSLPRIVVRLLRVCVARASGQIIPTNLRRLRRPAMAEFHFCKVFHKATGLKFTDYVARVRLENARNRLLNPNLCISEIAYDAGFQSLTQFNRTFKRVFGQSPTEFRTRVSSGRRARKTS